MYRICYGRWVDDARIRRMAQADLAAVGVLAGKLLRLHTDWDRLRFLTPDDPERGYARWFSSQLPRSEVILLVAEDDQGICGYTYAAMEGRSYNDLLDAHAKLHDIFVDERTRRRGVARRLLEETMRIAREQGAPRMVLSTATQNAPGQALFAAVGFRPTMIEMTAELG